MSGDPTQGSSYFMMGEFPAEIPADRWYARNHMWAELRDDVIRFGFSAYAVRLLQDVYFLDWTISAPLKVRTGTQIGAIESKKAESDLFAPVDGELIGFNEALLQDPSAINVDKYGAGWLFEMRAETGTLLTPAQYLAHLDEVWIVAQRTIKGQLNE